MGKNKILIIGGGIIGLATAYNLSQQYPDKKITILEKEETLAAHQTGRNSGVLHSGIYYKPGSLKARNCRRGKKLMEAFCAEQGIDFKLCGKVIVATEPRELEALQMIYARGQANGVDCTLIDRERLLEIEPHVNGIKAIHVPEAGITDYRQVCLRFAEILQERGHQIVLGTKVMHLEERPFAVTAITYNGDYSADFLVNCTGLHSDRLTRKTAGSAPAQIVPFRGEYYELKPAAWHLCQGLIYPVPDPRFPFLGVHFTLMINGSVECGPNAVLAFAREGYVNTDLNLTDLWETLSYSGFQKLAQRHWRMGSGELWRSFNKNAFVTALQKLVPDIRAEHLEPAPAGIRAQAVKPDGTMLDDFAFQESGRIVNVVNAPSPAATSSISIGQTVVEKLAQRF